MPKKLDLEALKNEFVNTTFGLLTITDVVRDLVTKNVMFVCKCVCGNTCVTSKYKVISGHTKSCGCYNHSKEKSKKHSEWLQSHRDLIDKIAEKTRQWYKDNTDKVVERSLKHKQWWVDHSEQRIIQSDINRDRFKSKRIEKNFSELISIVHPKYIEGILSGIISTHDFVEVVCPMCGKYDLHKLHNLYLMAEDRLKYGRSLLCSDCQLKKVSLPECEVYDFILTFYSSEPLRNNREVLCGKELDLYYPEKKIAIEFNGDYWHSCKFKDNMYHYNKFKMCKEIGITLVSIFECDWLSMCDDIKDYLRDLFEYRENKLSFIDDHKMNNNYSSPICASYNYNELVYHCKNNTIYTCGFSCL